MKHILPSLILLSMTVIACAPAEPPQRILFAPMAIASVENGEKKAERLRIRPVDLYNIFDRDVKGKKWRKVHENSWSIIIDGRNTATGKVSRMTITLLVDPDLNDMVVVREIREAGQLYSSEDANQIIRSLDKAFNPMK